ncbi:MAG: hypothetical protein KJP00_10515, partial [Bacteroidia bacterium]|nr:hypothetical protein [Bacteroidia bacterium]
FSIFPMPKEWALDGVEITDNMKNELKNYIDKPFLNTTLKPGEKSVIAIGTLYSRPPKSTGVLPNTLFVHSNSGLFPTCKWVMKKDPSSDPMALGLRLNFGPSCTVIPCGQVSYPDQ